MTSPDRALLGCLAALVLLAAACGGTDETAGGPTSITVVASEFQFEPALATVAAGQDVTITLENSGTIEHEWAILGAGINLSSEAELDQSQVLFKVPSVPAGQSAVMTFNVAAGSYQIICTIAGHFTAGMAGSLTASS